MTLEQAKEYIKYMNERRAEHEQHNKYAYQCADELHAWINLAEYGSDYYKKIALKVIKGIQ